MEGEKKVKPQITMDILQTLPWDNIIGNAEIPDCHSYFEKIEAEIRNYDPGSVEIVALKLINSICSMGFNYHHKGEPFVPMFSFAQGRTFLPEDLPEEILDILYEFAKTLENKELQSRLLDTLWVKRPSFGHEAAKLAIPAYLVSAHQLWEKHPSRGNDRFIRAVNIAFELGPAGYEIRKKALQNVYEFICQSCIAGCEQALPIIRLLYDRHFGDPQELAQKCLSIARDLKEIQDYNSFRDYAELATKFLSRAKEQELALKIKEEIAESYLDSAKQNARALGKAHFLGKALETFRQLGFHEEAEEIHRELLTTQKKIAEELYEVSVEVDLTELVNEAITTICKKSLLNTLINFVTFFPLLSRENMVASLAEQTKQAPIFAILGGPIIDDEGKTVAKKPFTDPAGENEFSEEAIFQAALPKIQMLGEVIFHVLNKIRELHHISHDVLLSLTANHPFIAEESRMFFSRGLKAGFDLDFASAALFLVPQIENSIRFVLKTRGVMVSKKDHRGIQKVKRLEELLDDVECEKAFGKNNVFTMKALLVEPAGINLRNEIAHGLSPYNMLGNSPETVFLWWFVLRMIMVPYVAK